MPAAAELIKIVKGLWFFLRLLIRLHNSQCEKTTGSKKCQLNFHRKLLNTSSLLHVYTRVIRKLLMFVELRKSECALAAQKILQMFAKSTARRARQAGQVTPAHLFYACEIIASGKRAL